MVADRILFYSSRLLTLPTAPPSENTLMLVRVAAENQLSDHAKRIKWLGWIGTSLPLSHQRLEEAREAGWVCVCRWKGLWGLVLQELGSDRKRTPASRPSLPVPAQHWRCQESFCKQDRRGRSFLNMLINKECTGRICRDLSNASTEFQNDTWFKINKHIRCRLWGLYQKLISFTDLAQCIFFKMNHLFFTTAYKIHLDFMIIFGNYI